MKTEDKAKELVEEFENIEDHLGFGDKVTLKGYSQALAKQCALIAVEEILKSNLDSGVDNNKTTIQYSYWQEVKQHIEQL